MSFFRAVIYNVPGVAPIVAMSTLYGLVWLCAWVFNNLVVLAVAGLICLGLLCFFLAKSGNALVRQTGAIVAAGSAFAWAGALTLGLIVGSIGLFIAMQSAFASDFNEALSQRYTAPTGPNSLLLAFRDWIVMDSYGFFLRVATLLYFSNRVFVARTRGGSHWLGVVPPVFAIVLFWGAEYFDVIVQFFQSWDAGYFNALVAAFVEEIALPFELALMAMNDPMAALAWGRESLLAAEGSFFKLGTYFPAIFGVVTLVIAAQHIIRPVDFGP